MIFIGIIQNKIMNLPKILLAIYFVLVVSLAYYSTFWISLSSFASAQGYGECEEGQCIDLDSCLRAGGTCKGSCTYGCCCVFCSGPGVNVQGYCDVDCGAGVTCDGLLPNSCAGNGVWCDSDCQPTNVYDGDDSEGKCECKGGVWVEDVGKCCGDDGSADNFASSNGMCVNGEWIPTERGCCQWAGTCYITTEEECQGDWYGSGYECTSEGCAASCSRLECDFYISVSSQNPVHDCSLNCKNADWLGNRGKAEPCVRNGEVTYCCDCYCQSDSDCPVNNHVVGKCDCPDPGCSFHENENYECKWKPCKTNEECESGYCCPKEIDPYTNLNCGDAPRGTIMTGSDGKSYLCV